MAAGVFGLLANGSVLAVAIQALRQAVRTNIPAFASGLPPEAEYRYGFRISRIMSHALFRPYASPIDFEKMRLLLSSGG